MHRGAVRTLIAALAAALLIAPATADAYTIDPAVADEGQELRFPYTREITESSNAFDGQSESASEGADFSDTPVVGATRVVVATVDDNLYEGDETMRLVSPDGDSSAQGTIRDNDPAPALSISDATFREDEPAKLVVTAPNPSARPIVIPLSTNGGADVSVPQSVTLPAGQTSVDVPLTIADNEDEPDETFTVTLGDASGATIADRDGTVTILNDDFRVISVTDASTPEGDGGTANAQFLIRLNGPTFRTVTVRYVTTDGSATAPADYLARAGTATFAPGSTVAAVDVPVVGDDAVEETEVLGLALSDATNATLADASAVGVILDDDTAADAGDSSPPKMSLAKPKAKGRRVRVKVGCPRGERSCSGRVSVYATRDRRVGAKTFRLAGGRKTTIALTIPSSVLRAARRSGRLKLKAYLFARDAEDNYDTRTRGAKIRYRKRRG